MVVKKVKHLFLWLIAAGVAVGCGFVILWGPHGVFALYPLKARVTQLQHELATIKMEKKKIEEKIAYTMQPHAREMYARQILHLGNDDEITYILEE